MSIMNCENPYNKFAPLKGSSYNILTFLMENNQNLFKLIKYIGKDQNPYTQPDLSFAEKVAMICTDPYLTEANVNSNILFQTEIDEAFSTNVVQLRIEADAVIPINSYQGYVNIWFQIIVPNRADVLQSTEITGERRTDSIFLELVNSLNGVKIPNSGFNSPMFMDRGAKDGSGRQNGSTRERANKNYCSRWVCFSVLV